MAAKKAETKETNPSPEENTVSKAKNTTKEPSKPYKVRTQLDLNSLITVKNGFDGKLVYQSKKTGEIFEWERFGDEQDMELSELKNAKNSYKAFFRNNWFLMDDPEVTSFLGVEEYYKNSLSSSGFDSLFDKTPEEVKQVIHELSEGQKKTLLYRVKRLIHEGKIDSLKMIETIESVYEIELIER